MLAGAHLSSQLAVGLARPFCGLAAVVVATTAGGGVALAEFMTPKEAKPLLIQCHCTVVSLFAPTNPPSFEGGPMGGPIPCPSPAVGTLPVCGRAGWLTPPLGGST